MPMDALGTVLISLWAVATFTNLLVTSLTYAKFKTRLRPLPRRRPISILKPVVGTSAEIRRAIYSFIRLPYLEKDELIFCVTSTEDPAYDFVKKLALTTFGVPIKVVTNATCPGGVLNPKVRNIYKAFCEAKNDLILISDDNAIAKSDYLERLDYEFDGGILASIILIRKAGSFAGLLEQMLFTNFYARGLVFADFLNIPVVIGKSMLFRKSQINHECLLMAGEYLAEDYALAKIAQRLNLPIKLMTDTVNQEISNDFTLKDHVSRYLRWGVLIKNSTPHVFIVHPIISSVIGAGIIGAIGNYLHGNDVVLFIILHFSSWFIIDMINVKILNQKLLLKNFFVWISLSAIQLSLWFKILSSNKIRWRGNDLKVRYGGKIEF